jgi:predicted PurR-regulated permease PerM
MNPLVTFCEKRVFKRIKSPDMRRYLSVAVTVIVVIATFSLIMSVLIPQLFGSVQMFVSNLRVYSKQLKAYIVKNVPMFADKIGSSDSIMDSIIGYITHNYTNIISISTDTGKRVIEWIIAFILSVYLLLERGRMIAGAKRLLNALFKPSKCDKMIGFIKYCNKIMSKYVTLSLIDGAIVGIVTSIFMLIMDMEYVWLISIVVGVTNFIPTFGPIVGGVIGGFILLMVNPMHALAFVCFIIVLQMMDGYLLKPKLFGSSFGISGLWILIFILVGGNVFGIAGILLAIPMATIVDYVYHEGILKWLENRKVEVVDKSGEPLD